MTQDELRAEFEAWLDAPNNSWLDDPLSVGYIQWEAYQACNAKRQEELARDKALLRECLEAMQCPIKSQQMLEKLATLGITVRQL